MGWKIRSESDTDQVWEDEDTGEVRYIFFEESNEPRPKSPDKPARARFTKPQLITAGLSAASVVAVAVGLASHALR